MSMSWIDNGVRLALQLGQQLEKAEALLARLEKAEALLARPESRKEGMLSAALATLSADLATLRTSVEEAKKTPIPSLFAPFILLGRNMARAEMEFFSSVERLVRMLEAQVAEMRSAFATITRQS